MASSAAALAACAESDGAAELAADAEAAAEVGPGRSPKPRSWALLRRSSRCRTPRAQVR